MAVHTILPALRYPVPATARRFASRDGTRLATQLRGVAMKLKVLLVCSSSPHHSSSRLGYELGLGMVQLNHSPVLLLDLNSIAVSTATDAAQAGSEDPVEYVTIPCAAETLLLVSMPHQPMVVGRFDTGVTDLASFLSSAKFSEFVQSARQRFQYIIVAGPPVLESVLSLITAPVCDGAMLCVAAGKSRSSEVREAKAQLQRANVNIVGFVYDESRT